MSTAELRVVINEYLSRIDDASFLKAIKTIIETKFNEGTYKLSAEQKKRIKKGRDQLSEDRAVSDELVKKEIDRWLNTK